MVLLQHSNCPLKSLVCLLKPILACYPALPSFVTGNFSATKTFHHFFIIVATTTTIGSPRGIYNTPRYLSSTMEDVNWDDICVHPHQAFVRQGRNEGRQAGLDASYREGWKLGLKYK